jgi:anti-sigma B factor antagonist
VSLKLETRQVGDVVVVDADGRITLGEGAILFRDKLAQLREKGDLKILLNLGGVSYLDSSGLGELVSGYNAILAEDGILKLMGLNRRLQDLLQITKLYTVFEVFEDEAEALRSF